MSSTRPKRRKLVLQFLLGHLAQTFALLHWVSTHKKRVKNMAKRIAQKQNPSTMRQLSRLIRPPISVAKGKEEVKHPEAAPRLCTKARGDRRDSRVYCERVTTWLPCWGRSPDPYYTNIAPCCHGRLEILSQPTFHCWAIRVSGACPTGRRLHLPSFDGLQKYAVMPLESPVRSSTQVSADIPNPASPSYTRTGGSLGLPSIRS